MSEHPQPKEKLFKGQAVLTKRLGKDVEGTITDFYPNGMVLVEIVVKESFVANEANVVPKV